MIRKIDEDTCVDIIRSIYSEIGCENLNQFIIKIIMRLTDNTSTEHLMQTKNKITNTISKNKGNNNDSNENSNVKDQKSTKTENNNYSKFMQLPIDLILKTSFYLDEADIFHFERCCCLLYQIINNSLYVNQSNTFKTFNLTPQRLDEMVETQISFYKYSKATTLKIGGFEPTKGVIRSFLSEEAQYEQDIETKWQKAEKMSNYNINCDKWLVNMFKSIKSLQVDKHGSLLLSKLPLGIIFDPIESNLEKIDNYEQTKGNIGKFADEYTRVKNKFDNQGQKIRVLKRNRFYNGDTLLDKLIYVESKHIYVKNAAINYNLFAAWEYVSILNPSLRVMTFETNCMCEFDHDIDTHTNSEGLLTMDNNNNTCDIPINTLRFIYLYGWSSVDLVQYKPQLTNLDKSVKNLTLQVTFHFLGPILHKWSTIISNLLIKKYFFNLEFVNMLLCFDASNLPTVKTLIDWLFDLLIENNKGLNYQFKQLNVSLQICNPFTRCDIIKWNSKMDDKLLKKYQARCTRSDQVKSEYQQNIKIYHNLMDQWSN